MSCSASHGVAGSVCCSAQSPGADKLSSFCTGSALQNIPVDLLARHQGAAVGAKFEFINLVDYLNGGTEATLIYTYVKTLQNLYPRIKNARYDFATRQFIGANNLPIRRGDGAGSFDTAAARPGGRASRAGEASLRRGILIQSLISSESGGRSGILEQVLSRSAQFVSPDGGLDSVFSKAGNGRITAADKAIYSMAAEGKSAAEIIKFIAATSLNPFYRQLAQLLQKTGINPKITVGDGTGWKMNAGDGHKYAAAYNPKRDTSIAH